MESPLTLPFPELASEVHSTERVPDNLHEEESGTAHESTVRGMKDQVRSITSKHLMLYIELPLHPRTNRTLSFVITRVANFSSRFFPTQSIHRCEKIGKYTSLNDGFVQIVVSELTDATPDKEIVIDIDGAEKLEKLVEAKTNEILKRVEDISADVAKDLKDFAKDVRAAAEASIDSTAKEFEKTLDTAGDEAAKTSEDMTSGASDFASRIGSTISSALTKAEDVMGKDQQELLGSPEKPHEEKNTLIG